MGIPGPSAFPTQVMTVSDSTGIPGAPSYGDFYCDTSWSTCFSSSETCLVSANGLLPSQCSHPLTLLSPCPPHLHCCVALGKPCPDCVSFTIWDSIVMVPHCFRWLWCGSTLVSVCVYMHMCVHACPHVHVYVHVYVLCEYVCMCPCLCGLRVPD